MTLQRRVLLYLLISAPLVWAAGLLYGLYNTRDEIDELFDTQQVRLAQQLQAVLPALAPDDPPSNAVAPPAPATLGHAALEDLSIAVWDRRGALLFADRQGVLIPRLADADGFVNQQLDAQAWRTYYLRSTPEGWLVAVSQPTEERDELVRSLLASQLLPWVATLPALLLAMAIAVRRALKPVRDLVQALRSRASDELQPLSEAGMPGDLKPLVQAMNDLLRRMSHALEHERRFTADAAHELRTPLAALQSQWDASQLAAARAGLPAGEAQQKIAEGLERLRRLVTQMLSLERLEHLDSVARPAPIDWPALVEQVFSDVLPQAERRHVELACDWPPQGEAPLLREGDAGLLAVLLRNLLDNAVRHASPRGQVHLRLGAQAIEVVDDGPGVRAEHLPRLGERFFRVPVAGDTGSGLGLSIARRIAALHGLTLQWRNIAEGGLCARLSRAA